MADLESSLTQSRWGCFIGLVLALVVFAFIALSVVSHYRHTEKEAVEPAVRFERVDVKLGGELYAIPGGIAFIDGRDQNAKPPVTHMRIPMWDSPSELIEVATVRHGDQVELLDYREVKGGRRYVKVLFGGYSGWISEDYIYTRPAGPIGDQVHE
jgi:hypothetical protein